MPTLNLWVSYRPIRIGWCVRDGNLNHLESALRLTHAFWGGCYNPLIPVDKGRLAANLVRVFRPDALFAIDEADQTLNEFIESFPHLRWPGVHKRLFTDGSYGKMATILDIQHAIARFPREEFSSAVANWGGAVIYEWDAKDDLRHVLLSLFGGYPTPETTGMNYERLFVDSLSGRRVPLQIGEPIPSIAFRQITSSQVAAYEIEPDRLFRWNYAGLYLGEVNDFEDMVNFWNLSATGTELIFYDAMQDARLRGLKDLFLEELAAHVLKRRAPWDTIAMWSKLGDKKIDLPRADIGIQLCHANEDFWNQETLIVPGMRFARKSVLAVLDEGQESSTATFQLPEKPFLNDFSYHTQEVIISVRPLIDLPSESSTTFWAPFVPELNQYYMGSAVLTDARSETDGLGAVSSVTTSDMTIFSLKKMELLETIFKAFGISARPSIAGRLATGLIRQMGGIQGCRVFKIPGVRQLIEQHGPLQSFTRSNAIQVIRQQDLETGRVGFDEHEGLFIESRSGGKLTPSEVFAFLLKKEVFSVGLELRCPNCQLSFWLHIDDVATEVSCDLCRVRFNITPDLKDRDWAYRRSGIFGKDDHQQGSIPVALTIQQLDTALALTRKKIWVTAMEFTPGFAAIDPCETDFVVLTEGFNDRLQIAVGECKARGEITEKDVSNLRKVADAFPTERFEAFIIFSKTAPFTTDEIRRCRQAQSSAGLRVILLSNRELEPYFTYERAAKEFDVNPTAISLEDMARNSNFIYFNPRRRTG
jgi:hypothetical protein